LPFGVYVETHEDNTQTHTMAECIRDAICLGPITTFQGSYTFLCIRTGKRITIKKFKELPMSASVVKAVESLTTHDKQTGAMVFSNHLDNAIIDTGDSDPKVNGNTGVDDDVTYHDNQYEYQYEVAL
jgi:hypothetical protein